MWPDVMAPGWQWHLLATAGLLAAFSAVIGLLAKAAGREEPASPDPLLVLWHRYEVGDLTRREFERARTALARRKPAPKIVWTRPPAMDPAARRALNGSARPSKGSVAAGAEPSGVMIYAASRAERTSPGSA
jgi:hypothetical protein